MTEKSLVLKSRFESQDSTTLDSLREPKLDQAIDPACRSKVGSESDPEKQTASTHAKHLKVSPARIVWLKAKHFARGRVKEMHPPFEIKYKVLQAMQVTVSKFLKDANSYIAWQKQLHFASMELTSDFQYFYQHRDANTMGAESIEAREIINDFAAVCSACDTSSCESFRFYEKQVVEPLEQWVRVCEALKPKVTDLRVRQLILKYYSKKVTQLTLAVAKKDIGGKNDENQKQVKRLERNNEKLKLAKVRFEEANIQILQEMEKIHHGRFNLLSPVVRSHIQFHRERTEAYAMKADRLDDHYYNQ